MEAKAQARYIRVTPRKARRVVDLIRGRQATEAVAVLQFAPQAAGEPVLKVVQSAIANARAKADEASEPFDERTLVVRSAYVDEGPTMKRFRPRAQGRAYRIDKRTSHITVIVAPPEEPEEELEAPAASGEGSAEGAGRSAAKKSTTKKSTAKKSTATESTATESVDAEGDTAPAGEDKPAATESAAKKSADDSTQASTKGRTR